MTEEEEEVKGRKNEIMRFSFLYIQKKYYNKRRKHYTSILIAAKQNRREKLKARVVHCYAFHALITFLTTHLLSLVENLGSLIMSFRKL